MLRRGVFTEIIFMSSVTLYPSLSEIEQRLFAVPDAWLLRLAENDPDVPAELCEAAFSDREVRERIDALREALSDDLLVDADEATDMSEPPPFIKTLIAQKVAAAQADFGAFPSPGQMLRLTQLPTPEGRPADLLIAAPLTVLLDGTASNGRLWHGWMMAQEVQYAGFWDMLLEPEDEPFDPFCGMVQLWNPITLYLPANFQANVVGRLNPSRLSAVRALAQEFVQGDPVLPQSRPGFIAARATESGLGVVTGSPLGKDDDPRRAYQQCYHHVAELLNAPALAWLHATATAGILDKLRDGVAAAWRELTGILPQAVPPVAHAMHGEMDMTQIGLALRDDLFLFLSQSEAGIDLSLTYRGDARVAATIIDGGEETRSAILDRNNAILEYSGLSVNADNRLRLDLPDNKRVELPLRVAEGDAW